VAREKGIEPMQMPRTLAALALGLIVAACGSSSATPTPPPASSTEAPASTSVPTVAPSPTAEPVDVVALLTEQLATLKRGRVTMTGSLIVGNVQASIDAAIAFEGLDTDTTMTTTIGGVDTTVQTVLVAGSTYVRTNGGPWLPGDASTGKGLSSLTSASQLRLEDTGVVDRNGKQVHALKAAGAAVNAADLGFEVEGATNMTVALTYYADATGTPVGAAIQLRWQQPSGDATVDASADLELTFSQLGVLQGINIPSSVWVPFSSTRYHYTFYYPADWDYTKKKTYDLFISPSYPEMSIFRMKTSGYSLNTIAQAQAKAAKKYLGAKTTTNEAITVGGLKARLLTIAGSNKDWNGKVVFWEVVVVKGGYCYMFLYANRPGSEEEDLTFVTQVLSTLQFT